MFIADTANNRVMEYPLVRRIGRITPPAGQRSWGGTVPTGADDSVTLDSSGDFFV